MKETLALMASIVLVIALIGSSNFIAAQSSTPELRNSRICLAVSLDSWQPPLSILLS